MDSENNTEAHRSTKIRGDQNVISGNVSAGGISIQGRNANVTITQNTGVQPAELLQLFEKLYKQIEARPLDPNVDKDEIVETVQKIQEEVSKSENPNESKLARWMDSLNKMAPDIVDVALASLGGPVSGVTAVLKKIADRTRQQ